MKLFKIVVKLMILIMVINNVVDANRNMRRIKKGVSNTSKYANNVFDKETIKKIVDTHNKLRSDVANGKAAGSNGNLPTASDMLQMYWDESIAVKAQQYTNKCQFQHSPREYRIIGKMKLGENIYMSMTTETTLDPNLMEWEAGIKDWYSEIKDYQKEIVDRFVSGGPTIGHFTQVIWSRTYLVGCGFCSYIDKGQLTKLYFCQYGVAGNMIGSPNYKSGVPASNCPIGFQPSTVNPGLCCKTGACEKDNFVITGDFNAVPQSVASNLSNSGTIQGSSPNFVNNNQSINSPTTNTPPVSSSAPFNNNSSPPTIDVTTTNPAVASPGPFNNNSTPPSTAVTNGPNNSVLSNDASKNNILLNNKGNTSVIQVEKILSSIPKKPLELLKKVYEKKKK